MVKKKKTLFFADKLHKLITSLSLVETQDPLIRNNSKMRLDNIKIVTAGQEYYARVIITNKSLTIVPDIRQINLLYFEHLRDYPYKAENDQNK